MSHEKPTLLPGSSRSGAPGAADSPASRPVREDAEIQRLRRQIHKMEVQLDAGRRKLQRQLKLAAGVHRSLLPAPVRHERISVDVRYLPIEDVGGDYCQVRFPYDKTCYITMCDVTGHGIGPALLATRVSSEVRHSILYGRSPGHIVKSLNTFICEHFGETNLYLSLVVTRIDLDRRRITWSGAGHPSPLVIRRDGRTVEPMESQNPLIGVLIDGFDHQIQETLPLEPGDRLVFYTDGLTETVDSSDRQLGTPGLAQIAVDTMSTDLFETADQILNRVAHYEHGPTTDDKTLIVAEIK